jgi:molecular chaperone GrpE
MNEKMHPIEDHQHSETSAEPVQGQSGSAVEDQLTTLEREKRELNDKFLRLYSDFENYRKRTSKERLELMEHAGSEIVSDLLSVLDDFERAETGNAEVTDPVTLKEGFKLIHHKLLRILESEGLKAMETKGEPFNTDLHEAITNVPAPTPELVGKVVDEAEKGYTYKGKVLRYAKVVVGQ